MAKWTPEQRFYALMNEMAWQDVKNWNDLRQDLREKELLPFKRWIRKNLEFIQGLRAREAVTKYYLLQETIDNSSGFAVYLREGKSCLITAYKKDQAHGAK